MCDWDLAAGNFSLTRGHPGEILPLPRTGCSRALCVPVAQYCVRVYKRHVSLTSAVYREKSLKLVGRVRRDWR